MEKLKIKITILASLIVTAYAYIYKMDFLKTCYAIIATIIIFYFLGGFIEIFLQKQIDKIRETKKIEEENMQQEDFIEGLEEEQSVEIINAEENNIQ